MIINLLGYDINMKLIILPIINILIGIIVYYFIKKVVLRPRKHHKNFKPSQLQKINTARIMVINVTRYIIITLVFISILSVFGINVKSILAGLGIGTAIIGLAFQDLAKDLIAGFFIITEGEYEIGDTIEVDGFMGEVTSISLRTTKIKNFKGATKIVGNHYMDNIINYSNNNSLAVVDVSISYDCSEEKIEKAFADLFKKLSGKIQYATKDPEVWGVNDLSDSAVVYRVVVETEPMKQFTVERFLRKEIKKEFDKQSIKIPYQQIEVHNGK